MPSGEYEEKLHCMLVLREDRHLDIYALGINSGQYYSISILYPRK